MLLILNLGNQNYQKMSGIMQGKRGLVMGIANNRSIAWGIAQSLAQQGAELALSYPSEPFKKKTIFFRTIYRI